MVTLVIGGDVLPDIGDVFIYGVSVVPHPRMVHSALGVCPRFPTQRFDCFRTPQRTTKRP